LKRLKEENQRLENNVRKLTREISELRSLKVVNSDHPSYGELKLDLIQTKQDLNRAKEALAGNLYRLCISILCQCVWLYIIIVVMFTGYILSLW
jgi:hypothetical protein